MTTQVTGERASRVRAALDAFGLGEEVSGVSIGGRFVPAPGGPLLQTVDPTTGEVLARVRSASAADVAAAVRASHEVFLRWRLLPAPQRGDYVRRLGE